MSLYSIQSMGIQAHCSDLIVDPGDPEIIHFLSVGGYQITVKGIVANLLGYSGACIEIGGKEYDIACSDMGYKVLMKKLPSGLAQALIVPKSALPVHKEDRRHNLFSIITRDRKDISGLFFRHLDEKIDIPIDPSWMPWLLKMFRQEKWLCKLITLVGDFKGYQFEFHPARLHDLISEGIKKRTPEIIDCMAWKGDSDGDDDIAHRFPS